MKVNCWFLTVFCVVAITKCNYFFDNGKAGGLTEEQWLAKCDNETYERNQEHIIFKVKDLCTQLHCQRTRDYISIGFDYCAVSSTRCPYYEPNIALPFPECCPKRDCRFRTQKFKDFMKKTLGKKIRY